MEGKQKSHFPQSGEMADYLTMAGGFPTGLSFSTARRRDPSTSATLGKPLTRESLVTLVCLFRGRRVVAFMPRGRLACRGSCIRKALSTFPILLINPWRKTCQRFSGKNERTLTSGIDKPAGELTRSVAAIDTRTGKLAKCACSAEPSLDGSNAPHHSSRCGFSSDFVPRGCCHRPRAGEL